MMQQPVWWGERHQSLQLGFLRVGGGCQLPNSDSLNSAPHSLHLFYIKQSLSPPSLLCCMWAPHTEHHHRSQRSTPSPRKSNLLPLSLERHGSFRPDSWLRGTGEKNWLETMMYTQENCTMRNMPGKKQFFTMTYMCLYTRSSTHTTHYQFRASMPETPLYHHCPASCMQNFLAEAASDRPTFMARGTKICSSVAPHKTRMHRKVRQGCDMKTCLMHYSLED